MKNLFSHIILILLTALTLNCGKVDYLELGKKNFPGPGAPVGNDVISSTTNMSGKENETSPKLSPYAGAAFIQAPQINNYGTVSLSYTIEIPPGRDIQPGVGLSYSSSGGDGLVGIGWSMSAGLGSISRTTRHGQLYYDHRDTFTYNGKRLIKVEGPENSENGLYRLEIESGFSKFIMEDAESGGTWLVIDKAGTVTTYGSSLSSRIYHPDDQNKTYIWNFVKTIDLNGNYMTAEFDTSRYEENHILYIKEIRYTGNENTGLEANQYVRFHYKDRTDSYVSKSPGFIMKMDRLLDYIEIGWDDPEGFFGDNTELWRYTMVYETSEDSNRPLLLTVDSSRNTTKPEFFYQPAIHQFTWKKINNPDFDDPETNPDATRYFEGDFNGDGLSDMVFFNPETGDWKAAEKTRTGGYEFKIYGNRLQGYDNPSKIQWFRGNVTGDYNGDGRSDIAFYLTETKEFWVAEHDGRVFQFRLYGKQYLTDIDIMKCEWFPGDYDGNGLSDAILFNEPTGEWILMTNAGRRFEFIKFSQHFKNLFRNDYYPDMNMDSITTSDISEYGKDRDKVFFLNGDYNGDGRTDISIYDQRSGRWMIGENYRDDSIGFRLEWKLYKIFTAPEKALFGNDRFSGDFNGDGFSDFLLFDRETDEWIIGETLDGTIKFRMFSKMPVHKDITRWLQGDFNGDGRSDIGFFSKTDNNFWIGEATPLGFRYRIYNNLSYGPDPEEVLRTPLPHDEVKIANGTGVAVNDENTVISQYKYDANYHTDSGEQVFAGNFSGRTDKNSELLIYSRKDLIFTDGTTKKGNAFYYIGADGKISSNTVLENIDFNNENINILNNGIPMTWKDNKSAIIYFVKQPDYSGDIYHLYAIYNKSSSPDTNNFTNEKITEINTVEIADFNPKDNFYLINEFDQLFSQKKSTLVLDYKNETPKFVLFDNSTKTDITINSPGLDFKKIKENPLLYKIFAGKFTSDNKTASAQILIVEMNGHNHKWYLGNIDYTGKKIDFSSLTGNVQFYPEGYSGHYHIESNSNFSTIVYHRTMNNSPVFHKLKITETEILPVENYTASGNGTVFKGEYDHLHNPVIHTSEGLKRIVLDPGNIKLEKIVQDQNTEILNIERPDLMNQVYVFRWIQGDYNGDGKTDIGIFHLKERYWYYAMTQGTVPDMINKVKNGIGGIYEMEYVNSSTFDNTGEDDIPDLPMNYKVCSKLTVDDGRGNQMSTYYEYKNGYAFSDFINGYKENDYFGFGEFTTYDGLGNRTISTYYNVPLDDFRKNRALAGAVKEKRFIGYDGREYSQTKHEYKIHEIIEDGAGSGSALQSFLIEPVEVRKYLKGVHIQTTHSNIKLTPGKYEMISKTEGVTDFYNDSVHSPTSALVFTEFENIDSTNEMRLRRKVSGIGNTNIEIDLQNVDINDFIGQTPHETTKVYGYDTKGNVISETLSYTGNGLQSASNRVMLYEYDDYGNRTKQINASGNPTRIVEKYYDSKLHQFMIQSKTIGENIDLIDNLKINYTNAFGGVEQKTDPNGNSTYFEYDKYGRLEKQFADTDSGKNELASYTYSTEFPLSGKVVQRTGNGNEIGTRIFADGIGRNIHNIRSALNLPGKKYIKSGKLVYDPIGRVIRKSQTLWADDDEIDIYKKHIEEKYPTITEYDASGRVKRVMLPEGFQGEGETSISYVYNDPWEVIETHSVGRSKRTVKNGRGQVLYVEDFGTGDDNQHLSAMIGFAYDITGKRVKKMDLNSASMTLDIPEELFHAGVKDDSGNNIAAWKYDGFGQLIESSDPDLGYSHIVYNEFGNVIETTDSNNRLITMEYDRPGRPTVKHLPDNEGVITYEYDSLPGCDNTLGKVVKINDTAQTKTFSYDRMGRVKKETRVIHAEIGKTYVTDYKFDLMNRKTEITYPQDPSFNERMKVTYAHSAMGVTGIMTDYRSQSKNIISDVEYNEFGQMSKTSRGNNTITEYIYDIKGRLERLITVSTSDGFAKRIQDVTYEFKIDKSIKSVLNSPEIDADGEINSTVRYEYTYDGLNRLVKAIGDYQKNGLIPSDKENEDPIPVAVHKQFERGYQYALNGNITGKNIYDPETHAASDVWTYSYGGNNHAVTGIHTTKHGTHRFEMQYDSVGNMIYQRDHEKNRAKNIVYDSFNRIKQVVDPYTGDMMGSYQYDDQGFRVRKFALKNVDGKKRHVEILYPSMYFGVEKDYKKNGKKVESISAVNNIYLNGVRIAAVASDNSSRFYLTDQVDSVKAVVDDEGEVVTRMEYLPYGETWFQEGDKANKPKYNSQELDEETNFYYYNARHYDPEIARFVTADIMIDGENFARGWNRYMYVGGNPIVYKDPSGHVLVAKRNEFVKYDVKFKSTNKKVCEYIWGNIIPFGSLKNYMTSKQESQHGYGKIHYDSEAPSTRATAISTGLDMLGFYGKYIKMGRGIATNFDKIVKNVNSISGKKKYGHAVRDIIDDSRDEIRNKFLKYSGLGDVQSNMETKFASNNPKAVTDLVKRMDKDIDRFFNNEFKRITSANNMAKFNVKKVMNSKRFKRYAKILSQTYEAHHIPNIKEKYSKAK